MSQPSQRNTKFSGKSLIASLLLASFCLLNSGCDMKLPPMPWDPKPKPKAAAEGGDAAGAEEGDGGGSSEPPAPVNELDFLPPDMKKLPFEEVNIPLNDGLVIYGRLYDPSQKLDTGDDSAPADDKAAADGKSAGDTTGDGGDSEYKGPKYPLVILLHGIDRDHTTWSDLPVSLVKAGYSVFAMDLRGHGKSTSTVHQQRVTWRLFQPDQWLLLPKDVDQVIQHFQKDEDHPQIDGKAVGLVGEKLGANVAVFSGRDMSPAVKAIVLISPGLDYKGIIPSQAIIDYTNPALLITTQDDPYSYQSTERLYNWLLGVKALQVYKKIGDGSDMLSHQSALGDNITDWLIHQMPSPAKPKAVKKKTITVAEESPASDKGKAKDDKAKTAKPKDEKSGKPNAEKPAEMPKVNVKPKSAETKQTASAPTPSNRIGHADEAPNKPTKKAAGKKSKSAKSAAKKATSKTKPSPKADTATEKPNPGQPPIPGG